MPYVYVPIDKDAFYMDMRDFLHGLIEKYSKTNCPLANKAWNEEEIRKAQSECYHILLYFEDTFMRHYLREFPIDWVKQAHEAELTTPNPFKLDKEFRNLRQALRYWVKTYREAMKQKAIQISEEEHADFRDVIKQLSEELLLEIRDYVSSKVTPMTAYVVVNNL